MRTILILSLGWALPMAALAGPVADVPPEHWAYGALSEAVEMGLLPPIEGAFRGEQPLSRYEMARALRRLDRWLRRVVGEIKPPTKPRRPVRFDYLPPFTDVPPDHWAAEAVLELARRGILEGYPWEMFTDVPSTHSAFAALRSLLRRGIVPLTPDRRFRGEEPLTRGEAVLWLARWLLNVGLLPEKAPPLTFIAISQAQAASLLQQQGLLAGEAPDELALSRPLTRYEAVTLLARLAHFVRSQVAEGNPYLPPAKGAVTAEE